MWCILLYEDEVENLLGSRSECTDIDNPPFCFKRANYEWTSLLVLSFDLRSVKFIMETVLKRLNLGGLTEKFETERITPDLVCKLSVDEMEILGVTSGGDMMSLRIQCTKFGGKAPKKFEGTCGSPIFFIPKSALGNLLQERFTIKEISTS